MYRITDPSMITLSICFDDWLDCVCTCRMFFICDFDFTILRFPDAVNKEVGTEDNPYVNTSFKSIIRAIACKPMTFCVDQLCQTISQHLSLLTSVVTDRPFWNSLFWFVPISSSALATDYNINQLLSIGFCSAFHIFIVFSYHLWPLFITKSFDVLFHLTTYVQTEILHF